MYTQTHTPDTLSSHIPDTQKTAVYILCYRAPSPCIIYMYIENVCVSICIYVFTPYTAHKYTVYIPRRYIVYISPVASLDLDQARIW